MARPAAQAPNFRQRGTAKEFMTKGGGSFLILRFPDGSALVLKRRPGSKGGSSHFKPVANNTQIATLKKLGGRGATTYQAASSLLTQ